MIKYLFILVNAFTVFLFSLFGGDNGITVSGNIPKTITAGQEVPIELKVTKGSMSGFAKLQLELPEGLTLKEGDNRGANFSYADGIAKWVWASLPSESDIIVKATLVASSAASGAKTIGAKYSYVENNAKQVVEMTPIEITIEAGSGANAVNTTNVTTTPTETTSTNNTTTAATTNTESSTSSNKEPAGKVTVIRTITKGASDAEYIVNLKVQKGATRGFARYSDDLPAGLTAKAISTDGSSFSVADGKVKFVWVSVLLKDELELSYSLTAKTSVYATLKGEYSYLEDNQSKKYALPAEQLAITIAEAVANTTPTTTTEPANTVVTTPTVAVVTPTETAVTPTVAVTTPTEAVATTTTAAVTPTENVAVVTPTETPSNTTNNNTTTNENNTTNTIVENTTKQEGNVNYMVQIGAFTNGNVTASVLKRQFRISEDIKSEMQGGFSKFMVGSHNEYRGARDQRERVRNNNGVKGAFVVAYNQSKRITVQEALMISNQKWYK